jgi:hypothetical protein
MSTREYDGEYVDKQIKSDVATDYWMTKYFCANPDIFNQAKLSAKESREEMEDARKAYLAKVEYDRLHPTPPTPEEIQKAKGLALDKVMLDKLINQGDPK